MHYVYLLQLEGGKIYVGSAPNLKRRIPEHKKGRVKSTKYSKGHRLVWYGCFENRILARRFEKYLKSGSGKAFLKKRFIN